MPDALPLPMKLNCDAAPSLHFKSFSVLEEVSRLYEIHVVAVSEDAGVSAKDVLGTPASVHIQLSDEHERWFHGLVTAFGIDGVEGRYFRYRLVLRPWLWLLTRSAGMRVFQDMSVPDIVKKVFSAYPSQVADKLTGSYEPRVYCVQYRETDFDFVSRLLEEEGIFYFFRHSAGGHELVLADASDAHEPVQGFEDIEFVGHEADLAQLSGVSAWHMQLEIQTGKFTVADYNFETPATSLRSDTVQSQRGHGETGREVYDYPAGHEVKAAGDKIATRRLEELSARHTRYSGQGNTPGLAAGARFALSKHPREDQNTEYLVLQTRMDAEMAGYEAGVGGTTRWLCRFVVQQHSDPFRPPRLTYKPVVHGLQTAVVVGPSGEEIHTDKHGRVKVQFHWDREGQKDGNSSCWVRVAQGWAGKGFGLLALPRVGHEVVVAFLEGDPDRPLIIGSVYNETNVPPYALPDHKNVTSLKSRSTREGAAADFNELRFDDTKGSELLLLHAQKDRQDVVENDLSADVANNVTYHVGNNHAEAIEGEMSLSVAKAVTMQTDAKWSLLVAEDIFTSSDAQIATVANKDFTVDAGMTVSLKSGTDVHVKSGTNSNVEAGTNVHIKGGVNVVLEAGVQLTIKAGASSVVLGPDGVSITGTMVKINSGGGPGSGGGSKPVKASKAVKVQKPKKPADPLKGKHR